MFYTVYILYTEHFKKHYTGYTSNLDARFLSHNELGNGCIFSIQAMDKISGRD
ncbi:MAG TPA: GIY-YIG nuclease family protein [Chitinophagaceae bacterium]